MKHGYYFGRYWVCPEAQFVIMGIFRIPEGRLVTDCPRCGEQLWILA